MLLYYLYPGNGSVLGLTFCDHYLDAPDELAPEILENPAWRVASEDECRAHLSPEPAAKRPARKAKS